MAEIKIIIDGEEHVGQIGANDTILGYGENAGLDLPFSCRGGICSTCMAQCSEGTVEMANNQVLTDGEVEEGFILTCQSKVTSDYIQVNYDI